ncbi:hypothetical protein BU16DRAFT_143844 [Lophium mytilinum]|uniref:non-specific serine/threonine protein kinase n=1 Tax=Lophium mytilinum TaxID=390894 RepID=A0A6A6QFD1_9PEZI|nr:hypothetical protein BU16DRAFT_143844 [Lophium mytilinum]
MESHTKFPNCESPASRITQENNEDELVQDSTNLFDSRYVSVHPAGNGFSGDVTFCFLRKALKAVVDSHYKVQLPDYAVDLLKAQLCVVKTLHNPATARTRRSLLKELDVLQRIKASRGKSKERLPYLVDAHISDQPWMVTAAVRGPTLESFLVSLTPGLRIPERLFWHLYIQLSDAFRFLHALKPQAIAHGDIHSCNILLEQANNSLPNVVLVDFGCASIGDLEDYQEDSSGSSTSKSDPQACKLANISPFSYDVLMLAMLLDSLIADVEWICPHARFLIPFPAYLEDLVLYKPAEKLRIESLWAKFGIHATIRRDYLAWDKLKRLQPALDTCPVDDECITRVVEEAGLYIA